MDPNRLVMGLLNTIQQATNAGARGNASEARERWDEAQDYLSDIKEFMGKGGFVPTLNFDYKYQESSLP